MSTSDGGSMFSSFVIVAFATALVFLLLRPREAAPRTTPQPPPRGGGATYEGENTFLGASGDGSSNPKTSSREACTRTPDHVSATSATVAHSGGANLLVDGLVAFRHTKAAAASKDTDQATQNRKERARVLTRLLMEDDGVSSAEATMPPSKGGTLLVSIPLADVGCPQLARVLYLLASYYSLMVVVAVDSKFSNKTDRPAMLQQLYRDDGVLTKDILPEHRIVTSSTIAGRVAFARQLQRIEMVLEFDPEVRQNLSRFGHRVVLYNTNKTTTNDKKTSMLGQKLL